MGDNVKCEFKKDEFDLTIHGLNGKNYRLLKDNLDKDIIPGNSKIIVKKDKVVVKLAKVKGEYSYDHWTGLTSKKTKEKKEASSKDPMGGIMDMMRVIGEAMMKAQRGEKSDPPDMPGMGGMGGMGNLGNMLSSRYTRTYPTRSCCIHDFVLVSVRQSSSLSMTS